MTDVLQRIATGMALVSLQRNVKTKAAELWEIAPPDSVLHNYISLFENYEKSRQIKVVFQSDMIFDSNLKKSRQINVVFQFAEIFYTFDSKILSN